MAAKIPVLIVTHRLLMADLLVQALGRFADLGPIVHARNLSEARAALRVRPGAVTLIDPGHPTDDLFALARANARARTPSPTLIMADCAPIGWVQRSIAVAAAGFLGKCARLDEFVRAIRSAHVQRPFYSPCACGTVIDLAKGKTERFSAREITVLERICAGDSSKAIARRLGLKPKSVEGIRHRLMKRTGTSSATQLVRYALEERWVDLRPRGTLNLEGAAR